jgi:hypothetical protein
MKKWRILLVVMIVLALAVIVGSELLFDKPWSWLDWRNAPGFRGHYLLRNIDMTDIPRRFLMLLAGLTSLVVMGSLIMYAIPHRIRKISEYFVAPSKSLLRHMMSGLLGIMALGTIVVLSTFTVYTFPFSFLILLTLFFSALVGVVGLGYQLGKSLFLRAQWGSQSPLLQMSLGVFIIFATTRIPILGLLILLIVVSLCFGATLSTHFGSGKAWTLRPLLEEEL